MDDPNTSGGVSAITGAEVYRRRDAEGQVVRLPSGDVVRVRAITAVDLARAGGVPDRLTMHVFRDMPEMARELRGDEDAIRRLYDDRGEVIDIVACALLLEPRMVAEPEAGAEPPEGAIFPRMMPWADRMHLYRVATGQEVPEELAGFPGGPGAGVHPAPDGAGVLDPAVGDPRPRAG